MNFYLYLYLTELLFSDMQITHVLLAAFCFKIPPLFPFPLALSTTSLPLKVAGSIPVWGSEVALLEYQTVYL